MLVDKNPETIKVGVYKSELYKRKRKAALPEAAIANIIAKTKKDMVQR